MGSPQFILIMLKKDKKKKRAEGEERTEKKKREGKRRNHSQPTGEIKYSVLRRWILYYIFVHIDEQLWETGFLILQKQIMKLDK